MEPASICRLTVLYDASCGLCERFKTWLEGEPSFVAIECLPLQGEETLTRFPSLASDIRALRFIAVDDRGGVYFEDEARLMCLWALRRYRRLSYRLSRGASRRLISYVFQAVSRNRRFLSRALGLKANEPERCISPECAPCLGRGVR